MNMLESRIHEVHPKSFQPSAFHFYQFYKTFIFLHILQRDKNFLLRAVIYRIIVQHTSVSIIVRVQNFLFKGLITSFTMIFKFYSAHYMQL